MYEDRVPAKREKESASGRATIIRRRREERISGRRREERISVRCTRTEYQRSEKKKVQAGERLLLEGDGKRLRGILYNVVSSFNIPPPSLISSYL